METHAIKQAQNPVLKHTKQIAVFAAIATLLGASFAAPALAVTVTKFPNYKVAVSPQVSGCTYPTATDWYCVNYNVNGLAETWVKDGRFGEHWAQVYHEMSPFSTGTPSTGFKITSTGGNAEFRSYLDGLVFVNQDGVGTANARYGGNTFKYNTSTAKWELQNWFYAAKSSDGTYTISNVYVSYTRAVSSGDWTMGSLFESYVNNSFGSVQEVDAYDITRQWQSNELYISYPV